MAHEPYIRRDTANSEKLEAWRKYAEDLRKERADFQKLADAGYEQYTLNQSIIGAYDAAVKFANLQFEACKVPTEEMVD